MLQKWKFWETKYMPLARRHRRHRNANANFFQQQHAGLFLFSFYLELVCTLYFRC